MTEYVFCGIIELKNKNASVVQKRDQYIYTLFLEDANKFITFLFPALNPLVVSYIFLLVHIFIKKDIIFLYSYYYN